MTGLSMRFLGHSTVRIEIAGKVLLTDPVLTSRVGALRRMVPPLPQEAWAEVDIVLISHQHGDHLHLPSLRALGPNVQIVVPRGVGAWLGRHGFTNVHEIADGEVYAEGDLRVTATHAVHAGHRWGPRSTHGPDALAVGHLIESRSNRVYAAGDTDLFDGMDQIGAQQIDVALLPVWGWGPNLGPGHLDPVRAALAVERLGPRYVVPVHWGTLAVAGMCRAPGRAGAKMRRLLVEPPQEFAGAVSAGDTDTTVLIAQPGEQIRLDEA